MSGSAPKIQAFVRHDTLPSVAPPVSETGAVKWLRENLFSSVGNSIMTLLAAYCLYALISAIVPWVFNGVWRADSIRDCREVLDGAVGGCFAVIAERWPQLVFGNYPSEHYGRAVIAFLMLFVALAPILFIELPRKMLWFTGLFPFIAYWLIWGGTLWLPILALVGVVAGFAAFRALETKSFFGALIAGLVVTLAFWLFLAGPLSTGLSSVVPLTLERVESREIGGFMINFILGTSCIALSLPLGIALALGRQSNLPIIKMICVMFIEFIRGVPLITLLFVASVMLAYFLPPGTNFDLILRVIIMITLFASAYMAEAIRGGLAALPKGQYEAGDSLGLDYWQSMRLIILPQALKIAIPSIVNIAISLFKDTTLVSIISMFDMLGMIKGPILSSTDWFGVYWELYVFAALLFFVFTFGISKYSQYLERKLATDHR
ncbi:amino acid ABC transporter permease [Meridianimarinicoccus aquatilis]|uniref:Amino acid ABC transporter permease n=1 Tax=Meridianimarinicoccus aquatilis TaxID=2552766 RepID=A0A4R6ARH7_9RHOB|nr:amino acid ABC transporter permease [Fluviibacterium aquatile]QIE41353.1 amino acid ABC transporter permease [Rhodobacteraceae bacterium SC52]TDL87121.1 amino acid ABC transporter permease [Fluviibacterium aquatile]